MRKLQNAARWYLVSAALAATLAVLILCVSDGSMWSIMPVLLLTVAILILAGLGIRKAAALSKARLITENSLFQISPVKLAREDGSPSPDTEAEIVVSCFGVLADSQVIQFNMMARRLWRVELGRDCLKLIYGTKASKKQMTLLHEPMSRAAAQTMAERFRYETGAQTVFYDDLP